MLKDIQTKFSQLVDGHNTACEDLRGYSVKQLETLTQEFSASLQAVAAEVEQVLASHRQRVIAMMKEVLAGYRTSILNGAEEVFQATQKEYGAFAPIIVGEAARHCAGDLATMAVEALLNFGASGEAVLETVASKHQDDASALYALQCLEIVRKRIQEKPD